MEITSTMSFPTMAGGMVFFAPRSIEAAEIEAAYAAGCHPGCSQHCVINIEGGLSRRPGRADMLAYVEAGRRLPGLRGPVATCHHAFHATS